MELRGNVMIIGGAGFLGRGILRRAYREGWNCEFTVFSRDEQKQDLCKRRYPSTRFILGDIRDFERLKLAMAGHNIVIHAGALKYIPEAEFNVNECIAVNVDGSRCVLKAAREAPVPTLIGISTDKASQPINVYGMSKALMERLFGEAASQFQSLGHTSFHTVRYGNVVGSTGSVIPVFLRQLEEKGHITVTNPEMTRFWISVDEAIDLILIAAQDDSGINGSCIIPKPRAMKLGELALALAGEDAIQIIGSRPGEKIHEDLLHEQESIRASDYGDHYELAPVWYPPFTEKTFKLSSDNPEGGWLDANELHRLVEDSLSV